MIHKIKVAPNIFQRVEDGTMVHLINHDELFIQMGDEIHLQEFNYDQLNNVEKKSEKGYTGREATARAGFVQGSTLSLLGVVIKTGDQPAPPLKRKA